MHEQGKHGDEWGLNIPYNDNILGEDPSRGDQNTLQGVHESPSRPDVPSTIFFTLDGVCSMGAGPYFVLPLWYRRWNSFSPVTNTVSWQLAWCHTQGLVSHHVSTSIKLSGLVILKSIKLNGVNIPYLFKTNFDLRFWVTSFPYHDIA